MRGKLAALFGLTLFFTACTTPTPAILTHATESSEQLPIAMNDMASALDLEVIEVEDEMGAFYLKDGKGNTVRLDRRTPERYQLNNRSRLVEYPFIEWKNDELWVPIGAYNSICIDLGRLDKRYSDGVKVHRPNKDKVSYYPPVVKERAPTKIIVEEAGTPKTPAKVKATAKPLKGLTVVVDAGHGGKDPGGIGVGGIREKDIVLKVSLKLEKELKALGATVLMTRKTDRFLELRERSSFANKANADFFISVHANIASRKSAKGVETWFHAGSKRGNVSQVLSKALNDGAVAAVKANDRGARADQRGLHVLRATKMPAALVELGFMSNPEEAKLLANRVYLDKLAKGIAKGLVKYHKA